jgi:multidrug efflux pump subunit AcrA (membrane-fusion protein)
MLTEVDIPNPDGALLPGMYGQVQIENIRINPPLLVPGDSIITNANGMQVAVLAEIDRGSEQARTAPPDARRIHIVNVQVGRDYGPEIEVTSGLEDGQYVVVNPSDVIQEGAIVKPTSAPPAQGQQPRRGPSDRQPGGMGAPIPGAPDSGGRGASTPSPGGKGGKQP